MAPVRARRQRSSVPARHRREVETALPVWAWTVGDDSDDEDSAHSLSRTKRRVRRQELITLVPPADAVPPPTALEEDLPELSSSSESDGVTSNSSGGEEEVEEDETEPTPSIDRPSEEITESPSSSVSQVSSTSTGSLSFVTLIPGSTGEDWRGSDNVDDASRTIVFLTPIQTVVQPETTYTSFSSWTSSYDALPQTVTSSSSASVVSESTSATRAAQTSAVAEADSSPPPQIIRVHEHPHNLSKDAIHGLIAFGALGGLIGVLAVAWFFWRRHKKHNQAYSSKAFDDTFARPSRGIRFLSRVPFLKDRFANRSWFNIDEPYYKDNNNSRTSVYLEKSVSVKSTARPRLDSQVFAPNQVMGVAVRIQAGDNPPAVAQNVSGGFGHHPGASMSSTQPQRSGSTRDRETYFPTNPKHQSEISSLSSGFGDGDLLVPSGESTLEALPQPPPSAKFSDARRDTVYTEASEDPTPRFRNVNSWVRQQTGRVKRSQAKTQAQDAPPVPQMPAEETYAMMLPDGEEPRRPQAEQAEFDFGVAK